MMQFPSRHTRVLPLTLAVLAACGSSADTGKDAPDPGDAPAIDAAVDAVPIDAPPVRVHVTVLSETGDGQPDTTANVIFADSSNTLIKQGLVGAAGTSEADLPQGGFVHVLRELDTSDVDIRATIISIRARPGDNLTFGIAASAPQGAEVKLTGTYTPVTGVSSLYSFDHPCGTGLGQPVEGNVARLTSVEGCLPATFDVVATTLSAALVPPRYVWFTATPAGGFAAPAMQEMPAFTTLVTHVPVGSAVQLQRTTQLAPYFRDAASLAVQTTATTATVTGDLFYPPSPAALSVIEARISASTFAPLTQVMRTRVAGTTAAVDLDLAALPLPLIQTAPTLSGKVVSWTQTGTGTPDLRVVTAASSHKAGGWNYSVDWTVIDGATDSSLELPGLPAMFAEVDPTQQLASRAGAARVLYVDYSNLASFEEARKLALGSLYGRSLAFPVGEGLFDKQLYSVHASMH